MNTNDNSNIEINSTCTPHLPYVIQNKKGIHVIPLKYDSNKYLITKKQKCFSFTTFNICSMFSIIKTGIELKNKLSFLFISEQVISNTFINKLKSFFNCYYSISENNTFIIGGNLKQGIDILFTTLSFDSILQTEKIIFIEISSYNNYEYLFMECKEKLTQGKENANGFDRKNGFNKDFLKDIQKKCRDIFKHRNKNI